MIARIMRCVTGVRNVVHAGVLESEDEVDGDIRSIEQRVTVRVHYLRRRRGEGEGLEGKVFLVVFSDVSSIAGTRLTIWQACSRLRMTILAISEIGWISWQLHLWCPWGAGSLR